MAVLSFIPLASFVLGQDMRRQVFAYQVRRAVALVVKFDPAIDAAPRPLRVLLYKHSKLYLCRLTCPPLFDNAADSDQAGLSSIIRR